MDNQFAAEDKKLSLSSGGFSPFANLMPRWQRGWIPFARGAPIAQIVPITAQLNSV